MQFGYLSIVYYCYATFVRYSDRHACADGKLKSNWSPIHCPDQYSVSFTSFKSTASCGWVKQATDQQACPGGTVEFGWSYDKEVNNLEGFSIYKSGIPPVTMLTRQGKDRPVPKSDRVRYIANAGLRLSNVQFSDSGRYQITVIFKNESNNLAGNATLQVLSGSYIIIIA